MLRSILVPIIFQHDNACPHTVRATEQALGILKFESIPHPPCSPDLTPCNFYFLLYSTDLKGNHYSSANEVKAAITSWVQEKSEEFFSDRIKNLFYIGRNVQCFTVTMLNKIHDF